ncbi:MAG: hypothetical protein HY671_13680 [Chloroflexi bacterium]|nr:hypothetical protein [Chloroflexota bacterium]
MAEEERIDWSDPSIPVQFFALRREVIRLNLLVDQLAKALNHKVSAEKVDKPGSRTRAKAWKAILERHRQAIEPQGLEAEPKAK